MIVRKRGSRRVLLPLGFFFFFFFFFLFQNLNFAILWTRRRRVQVQQFTVERPWVVPRSSLGGSERAGLGVTVSFRFQFCGCLLLGMCCGRNDQG